MDWRAVTTYTQVFDIQSSCVLILDLWETSVNSSNNTSVLNWSAKVKRTVGWVATTFSWEISGDVTGSGSASVNLNAGDSHTLSSGSKTITHEPDGSKSVWVEVWADNPGHVGGAWIGEDFDLTTIATTSAVATITSYTNPWTLGEQKTISINKPSHTTTHCLLWWKVGTSGWKFTGLEDFNTGNSWTPSIAEISPYMTGNMSAGQLELDTHRDSDGSYIGKSIVDLNFQLPASSLPVINSVSIEEATASVIAASLGAGNYLQGVSTLKFTYTITPVSGTTIQGYKLEIDGQTLTTNNPTTDIIQSSGTVPYILTVTDSKGMTQTHSGSVTIAAYAGPQINNVIVERTSAGTTMTVKASIVAQSIKPATVEKNKIAVCKAEYREKGTETWSLALNETSQTGLTYTVNQSQTILDGKTYEIRIQATDNFSTKQSTQTLTVSGIVLALGKAGVGLGKLWTAGRGALDVLGTTFMNVPAGVTEALNVTGTTSLTGNTTITGDLNVNGAVTKSGIVLNPGIKYYNNGTQAFAAGSNINVLLPAVAWSDTGHGTTYTVNDGGRVTFSVAGRYIIIGQVAVSAWGADGTGEIGITKNGVVQQMLTSASCYYWKGEVTAIPDIAANDYIQMYFRSSTATTSDANGIKLTIIKLA